MFRRLSQKAFASISEVVVTAIIFTVAAAGILSTISSIRSKGGDSGRRLQAAYAAKQQMDLLRGQIDARMWLNSQSDVYPGVVHSSVYDVNGVSYGISWVVKDVPEFTQSGTSYLREVEMNVTY